MTDYNNGKIYMLESKKMTYTAKIYKITCSCCDKIYVGSCRHKKGLSGRMYGHHSSCNQGGTSKLYNHMREQGFEKFTILLIEEVEVKDIDEQRKLENDKIQELNTIKNGLNERRAYASLEVKKTQKQTSDKKYRSKRENMDKANIHRKIYRDNLPKSYICECCNYSSGRKDTYDRHMRGGRHLRKVNTIHQQWEQLYNFIYS